jgi:hypothetical protein
LAAISSITKASPEASPQNAKKETGGTSA